MKLADACECGHFETSHAKADEYNHPRQCRRCACTDYYYSYAMSRECYNEAMERRYKEHLEDK